MKPPKNQLFLNNSTDPTNGKLVKEIWRFKLYDHDRRQKYDLIWQYYRDRARKSVADLYKELYKPNKVEKLRVIYSGDSIIHEIECPNIKLMEKEVKENIEKKE
jgi:hypothetical protein